MSTATDSRVEICNAALVRLGQSTITGTQLTGSNTDLATLMDDACRDVIAEVVSEADWTSLTKPTRLATPATLGAGSDFEFDYSHDLPSDYDHMVDPPWLNDYIAPSQHVYYPAYKIFDGKFYTDLGEVEMYYVYYNYDVADTTGINAFFVDLMRDKRLKGVVIKKLIAAITYAITADSRLMQINEIMAEKALKTAKVRDASQNMHRQDQQSRLIQRRYRMTTGAQNL